MNGVVLLKEILDWELPASDFRIDPDTGRPAADLGQTLLGPFECNALELALQLRDAGAVQRLTAVLASPGGSGDADLGGSGDAGLSGTVDALRRALTVRCDEAVHVVWDGLDGADPSLTAELLVATIGRLEDPGLVLAGQQAGDWDHGQVGYLVAERLGWPVVGPVFAAEPDGDRLVVRCAVGGRVQRLAVRPPAVLTVASDPSLVLRMGTIRDRMAANRKQIERWTVEQLGLSPDRLKAARRLELERLWVPEVQRHCEMIEGERPDEVVAAVLARLEELKLLTRPA